MQDASRIGQEMQEEAEDEEVQQEVQAGRQEEAVREDLLRAKGLGF